MRRWRLISIVTAVLSGLAIMTMVPAYASSRSSIEMSYLVLQSPLGNAKELVAGHQLVIFENVTKTDNNVKSFVLIVEVRDPDGITIFLGWQTLALGSIGDGGAVGMSWIPEHAGTYSVRTFALTDIRNPEVLSTVVSSEYQISDR